jgi:hypothetical protein
VIHQIYQPKYLEYKQRIIQIIYCRKSVIPTTFHVRAGGSCDCDVVFSLRPRCKLRQTYLCRKVISYFRFQPWDFCIGMYDLVNALLSRAEHRLLGADFSLISFMY